MAARFPYQWCNCLWPTFWWFISCTDSIWIGEQSRYWLHTYTHILLYSLMITVLSLRTYTVYTWILLFILLKCIYGMVWCGVVWCGVVWRGTPYIGWLQCKYFNNNNYNENTCKQRNKTVVNNKKKDTKNFKFMYFCYKNPFYLHNVSSNDRCNCFILLLLLLLLLLMLIVRQLYIFRSVCTDICMNVFSFCLQMLFSLSPSIAKYLQRMVQPLSPLNIEWFNE